MNASLRIDILWIFALGLALTVAWFIASGLWIGAVGAIAGIAILLCAATWPGLLPTVWVLGAPTLFVMVDNALFGVPLFTVERALFLVIALPMTLHFLVRPEGFVKPGRVEKAMALYVAVMFVSWITHLSGKSGADMKDDFVLLIESFVMPFFVFYCVRNLRWNDRQVDRFLWLLVAGAGTYLVVVGLLQQAFRWDFFLSIRSVNEHPDRVTGPFTNALEYGIVMMLILLSALYLYIRSHTAFARVALLILMLGMVVGLVLCKGRAVWMSIPLALAIVFVRVPSLRKMLVVGALLVGAALIFGPMLADPSDLSRRLGSSEEYYNRMALWGTALNMIAHAPIFGYGFGALTFFHHKPEFYHGLNGVSAVWAEWPSVPHNELLNSAVLADVFGLAGCLFLWATVWRSLGRAAARGSTAAGRELAPFVQAGFLVVAINALFLDLMFLAYVPVLFYFLAALALRPATGE